MFLLYRPYLHYRVFHKRLLSFAFLAVGMCSLTACTQTVKTYNSQWAGSAAELAAQEPKTDGKTLETLSVAELVSKGNTESPHGNQQLARMYYAMAIKKDPESVKALAGMGSLLLRHGSLGSAQKAYQQILNIDPDNRTALVALARIDRIQGRTDRAIELLNQALEGVDGDAELLNELAMTYDAVGQSQPAALLYEQVVSLRPESAAGHNNQGFNFMLQEDYQGAITAFRQALTLEPANAYAQNNLAAAFALNGQEERALRLFSSTENKAVAYNNLGYLYMTSGKLDKAEAAFKTALELKPSFYVKAQENLDQLDRLRRSELNNVERKNTDKEEI